MSEQPGRRANSAGDHFKNDIASRLVTHGYDQRPQSYLAQPGLSLHSPYFVREARGLFRSIYGMPLQVDFYAWHPTRYPDGLIIEGRYQNSEGTVDEKFPYIIANLHAIKLPAILVLLCPGAKSEGLRWCLDQQEGSQLRVFTSWEGFIRACNDGLL